MESQSHEERATDGSYPVRFSVDYPDRPLDRLTTFFRAITVIPIAVVINALNGLLFAPVLLLLVFRHKYPYWWYEWNLQLQRFANRVVAYTLLMDDRYPSTDDPQAVHLDYAYPDAGRELNRWLPLVKWLLAIPHLVVLVLLYIGAVFAVIGAWFAIVFTGRYPQGIFRYVEGVMRWQNRVVAYAVVLVTDSYPPFRLRP